MSMYKGTKLMTKLRTQLGVYTYTTLSLEFDKGTSVIRKASLGSRPLPFV